MNPEHYSYSSKRCTRQRTREEIIKRKLDDLQLEIYKLPTPKRYKKILKEMDRLNIELNNIKIDKLEKQIAKLKEANRLMEETA